MQIQMIPLNDLSRSATGDSEDLMDRALSRIARSGSYILGEEVASFESEFSEYLGVSKVATVASGTDAIIIALRSLGVSRFSKVALTPNAGGYTATALMEIGAEPVFVDCDDSGRMDPESLELTLKGNREIFCVVATHLYGLDSNVVAVKAICKSAGIPLLEDCAQSTGAEVGGKKLGSFGEVATFSFYPTKNLGGIGDGGAIATNSEQLNRLHRRLRQYGWDARYEVGIPFGKNSRMDELQAAILRLRLPLLDPSNERRLSIWASYFEALQKSSWRIIGEKGANFVGHLAVLVSPIGKREAGVDFLTSHGIGAGIHYPILDYQQPGWRNLFKGSCPNAENLVQRILTIPLFPRMTDAEVKKVSETLQLLDDGVI
jgi:dTDP-3-amino-2,3,6-trideoxy-4-keto-D-glucose/dTDP-3-amino-3,4,6-trideoxy-alpha-D-glucose/dTDP-2,6-dideoxy-D-kanosamine transaminase